MKRSRGRRRHNGGQNHNNPNRSYDSNGPDVKIRGTAAQVCEKYQTLARDATSAGERILAESYQQYAEHYLRIVNTIQAQRQQNQNQTNNQQPNQDGNAAQPAPEGNGNPANGSAAKETSGMDVVTPSASGPSITDGSGPQPNGELPAFLQKPVATTPEVKPRTRRKKADNDTVDKPEDAAASADAPADGEKPKRGRPRKKFEPKADTPAVTAQAGDNPAA